MKLGVNTELSARSDFAWGAEVWAVRLFAEQEPVPLGSVVGLEVTFISFSHNSACHGGQGFL